MAPRHLRRAAGLWRRPAARLRLERLHLEGEPRSRAASSDAHPDRACPADLVLRRLSPGTRPGAGREHGPSVARKECHVIRSAPRNRHPESEVPVKEGRDLRGPGAPLAKELASNRLCRWPLDHGSRLVTRANPALTATPIRPDGAVLQQSTFPSNFAFSAHWRSSRTAALSRWTDSGCAPCSRTCCCTRTR